MSLLELNSLLKKNAYCYKHENANVWLKIRRLKNSETEAKFLLLWLDGRGSEVMDEVNGKLSFTDNKHKHFETNEGFHVTINFDGDDTVSVTTPDFIYNNLDVIEFKTINNAV